VERRAVFSGRLFPALLVMPQLAVTGVFFFWPAGQALLLLRRTRRRARCPNQPDNRAVIMVARVKPAFEVADLKLAALDPGARHGGGQVLPMPGGLEIVTWNTGKAADLKRYGNRSHAEAQFYELMQKPGEPGKIRDFSSIEIEISHSPCTACADMLVGLLRDMKAKGTAGLPAKEKFGWKDAAIPAASSAIQPARGSVDAVAEAASRQTADRRKGTLNGSRRSPCSWR